VFKKILVPIDLSGGGKWALATALELAQRSRARVTLIHVIHRLAGVQPGEFRDFYQRLLRMSDRKLKRAAGPFAAGDLSVRTEVCIGEPVTEIVRAAAKNDIDLIVMGSHTVDPTRPSRGWGTISYRVSLLCPCPVLLVKRSDSVLRPKGPIPRRRRATKPR